MCRSRRAKGQVSGITQKHFTAAQAMKFCIVGRRRTASDWRATATEDGELFFEQVVKRLASIVGPAGRKASRGWRRRNGYRGRSRILLDGGAECVESAVVSGIFLSNALRYGAGALELRGGVEIRTLLAAVKLEAAARTSSLGIKPGLKHGAAIGTPRPRNCAHHSRSPRPDLFLARAMFGWTLFFLFRGIGLHVAPVAILPLQKLPPGDVLMITRTISLQAKNRTRVVQEAPGALQSSSGESSLQSQTNAVLVEKIGGRKWASIATCFCP